VFLVIIPVTVAAALAIYFLKSSVESSISEARPNESRPAGRGPDRRQIPQPSLPTASVMPPGQGLEFPAQSTGAARSTPEPPGPTTPAPSTSPAVIWATPRVGSQSRGRHGEFEEKNKPPTLMVGLKVTVGQLQERPTIFSVEPMYQRTGGLQTDFPFGQFGQQDQSASTWTRRGKVITLEGKVEYTGGILNAEYAVGGLIVSAKERVYGFKVVFCKVMPGREKLDLTASFESDWVGTPGDGELTLIGGNGLPVVGVHGAAGWELEAIGLFLTSKTEPAAQEKAKSVSHFAQLPRLEKNTLDTLLKSIRESAEYKANYNKGERAGLAGKLLQKADESTVADPSRRFALLCEARNVAIEEKQWNTAWRATDTLVITYGVSRSDLLRQILDKAAKGPLRGRDNLFQDKLVIQRALGYVQELALEERFDDAEHILSLLPSIATKSSLEKDYKPWESTRADLARQKLNYEEFRAACARLENDAGDSQAKARAGRYLCFQKGLWIKGLPLLAGGAGPPFNQLAADDLTDPTDEASRLKLAEGWWDASQLLEGLERKNLQRRAGYWYRRCAALSNSVPRVRLDLLAREDEPRLRFTVLVNSVFSSNVLPRGAFTSIELEKDQMVEITALGQWKVGQKPHGAKDLLIAAIGEVNNPPIWTKQPFDAERVEFKVLQSGKLFLGLSDAVEGVTGSAQVQVEIW
jgi:hypothetical protein